MFCARVARSTANLSGARVAEDGRGGEGRGTLYCCRFTRHAYLTPAFPFPSSLIPFRSHPPQSLCFLATNRRTPPSPPRALSIYRALISAPRITPVRVRSHTRWIDTRDSKEPRLDRGGAQCPQREREREDEAGCLCNMKRLYSIPTNRIFTFSSFNRLIEDYRGLELIIPLRSGRKRKRD